MSSEKYTEISRALVQECLDRANKSQDNQIQVKAQIEIELENFPDPPIIVEVNFCKVVPFEIMLNFLTELSRTRGINIRGSSIVASKDDNVMVSFFIDFSPSKTCLDLNDGHVCVLGLTHSSKHCCTCEIQWEDVGVLCNRSLSEKALREAALDTFKRLSGETRQPVEDKAFYDEMQKLGKFTRAHIEKVFWDMCRSGVIYEVNAHFFKKA